MVGLGKATNDDAIGLANKLNGVGYDGQRRALQDTGCACGRKVSRWAIRCDVKVGGRTAYNAEPVGPAIRTTRSWQCTIECGVMTDLSAEGIMASGHANRANRPNTWLHGPNLQRHRADDLLRAMMHRLGGNSLFLERNSRIWVWKWRQATCRCRIGDRHRQHFLAAAAIHPERVRARRR